jgi:hypothetical protein
MGVWRRQLQERSDEKGLSAVSDIATEAWPQPYEGINGTVRDGDDLLSLEDEAMPRRRMMIMIGLNLRRATLVGNPAPIVAAMNERLSHPQPGDLVFETTTARRAGSEHRGFGILLEHRREWCSTDEDWARDTADEPGELRGDDNRPADDAWYVQYGPGERDIARWTNAECAAILTEQEYPPVPIAAH